MNTDKDTLKLAEQWFRHIAQIADDRKTANGAVMNYSEALDEIRVLARESAQYISATLKGTDTHGND